jgi:hypothetical protein
MSSFSLVISPPDPSQAGFTENSLSSIAPEGAEEDWSYVTLRSATAGTEVPTLSFGSWLEPRYIFAAGQLKLDQ